MVSLVAAMLRFEFLAKNMCKEGERARVEKWRNNNKKWFQILFFSPVSLFLQFSFLNLFRLVRVRK